MVSIILLILLTNKKDNPQELRNNEDNIKEDCNKYELTSEDITKMGKKIKDSLMGGLYHYGNQTFNDKPNNAQMELFAYSSMMNNLTKKQFDDYYQYTFGVLPSEYPDIHCSLENDILYKYDKENEMYVYNKESAGHGMFSADFIDYYVYSSEANCNYVTIDLLLLRGSYAHGYNVNGYDISMKVSEIFGGNKEVTEESEDELNQLAINYVKNNIKEFEKVEKYRYVFEKKNNDFFLREFSIIK